MSRYDGLIIPRSYSEYINKTDAATLLQALQLSGVMDSAPKENSNHPVKSSGVATAINQYNYPTIKETDANNCTAEINTIRAYELPTTASNIPSSNYVWNIIAIHNDRNSAHRLTQIAQGQSGQDTSMYIRVAAGTDGVTWNWGAWEKIPKEKTMTYTGNVDANGSLNIALTLPNKIISVHGDNKIYTPFVYNTYWVLYCQNVGGTKVTSGTELTVNITYI